MEGAALKSSLVVRTVIWIAIAIYNLLRRWLVRTLAAGPIPDHIAVIMDGNRRYAAHRKMEKRSGHECGYNTFMHALPICYDLGVKCVSVYAFSIENFRRSEEEVTALMNLIEEKLHKLTEKGSIIRKYGIRMKVLGELSLLPESLKRAAEEAMAATQDYDKGVLNIFVAYTSTREIVRAVEDVCHEVVRRKIEIHEKHEVAVHNHEKEGEISEEISLKSSVTAEEIERHLYTANCGEPQMLIRTSGETRLSNFMLWQSSFTFLYVTPVLWPELSFRHLLMAILEYQRAYPVVEQKKRQLKRLIISHVID